MTKRKRTLRGEVAIAGIGETTYYKHGQSPDAQFKLDPEGDSLRGLRGRGDRSARDRRNRVLRGRCKNPPDRVAAALGIEVSSASANMVWGGGGGGGSGAIGNAAMPRSTPASRTVSSSTAGSPRDRVARFGSGAGYFPARRRRLLCRHLDPVRRDVACADVRHAHDTPHARPRDRRAAPCAPCRWPPTTTPRTTHARSCRGAPSTKRATINSRWITEPFRLFDCCLENDGAAALILVAGRTSQGPQDRSPPTCWVRRKAPSTAPGAGGHNNPDYATSSFKTVAPRPLRDGGARPRRTSTSSRATRTSPVRRRHER